MSTQHMYNDRYFFFNQFLIGYWNQMAPDIYGDLRNALEDYRSTEGHDSFNNLREEIRELVNAGRIPSINNIKSAYDDPFWKKYGMILTIEDVEDSALLT